MGSGEFLGYSGVFRESFRVPRYRLMSVSRGLREVSGNLRWKGFRGFVGMFHERFNLPLALGSFLTQTHPNCVSCCQRDTKEKLSGFQVRFRKSQKFSSHLKGFRGISGYLQEHYRLLQGISRVCWRFQIISRGFGGV